MLKSKKNSSDSSEVSSSEEQLSWQDNDDSSWDNDNEFNYCLISSCVGFGNIMLFPYLCYKHGGGVFIVMHMIGTFSLGIPIFMLELAIGQISVGSTGYWAFCPLLRGLEYLCMWINFISSVTYVVCVSWILVYLSYSFERGVPWAKCRQPWSTPLCRGQLKHIRKDECYGNLTLFDNGTCYDMGHRQIYGIYNATLAYSNGIRETLPAEDFLNYESLKFGESSGLNNIGPLLWRGSICLALTCLLLFLAQLRSIKTVGKVSYFTITFPLFILVILIINSLPLDGSTHGLSYYLYFDFSRMADVNAWGDALLHVVFSLGLFHNVFPALASHNRCQYNILRSVFLTTFVNFGISFLAGIAVFTNIGVLAQELKISMEDLLSSGFKLTLVVYPQALANMPLPNIWNIAFFMMVLTLAGSVVLIKLHVIAMDVMKLFSIPIEYRLHLAFGVALVIFLLGLSMATPGGNSVRSFLDHYTIETDFSINLLLGLLAIAIYGPVRFINDIERIIGSQSFCYIPWQYMRWYFIICWSAVSPLVLIFYSIASMMFHSSLFAVSKSFPAWSVAIGIPLELIPFAILILTILWDMCKSKGQIYKRVQSLLKPHQTYGSMASKDKTENAYEEKNDSAEATSTDDDKEECIPGTLSMTSQLSPKDQLAELDGIHKGHIRSHKKEDSGEHYPETFHLRKTTTSELKPHRSKSVTKRKRVKSLSSMHEKMEKRRKSQKSRRKHEK